MSRCVSETILFIAREKHRITSSNGADWSSKISEETACGIILDVLCYFQEYSKNSRTVVLLQVHFRTHPCLINRSK